MTRLAGDSGARRLPVFSAGFAAFRKSERRWLHIVAQFAAKVGPIVFAEVNSRFRRFEPGRLVLFVLDQIKLALLDHEQFGIAVGILADR
jgi:hypothetical protein